MSGGEWLIRQPRPAGQDGYHTERVTVEEVEKATFNQSGFEPDVGFQPHAIEFGYADGRILIFPWANIVRAEYRPHPEP